MTKLKSFSPDGLAQDAERSGFFQCPQCGLIWFGKPDMEECPDGHGRLARVVLLCRVCDVPVPAEKLIEHLSGQAHAEWTKKLF